MLKAICTNHRLPPIREAVCVRPLLSERGSGSRDFCKGGRRPDVLCKVKNKLFRQNSPAPPFEGAGLGYAIFFYGGGGLRSALAGGDSLGGLTPDFGIV